MALFKGELWNSCFNAVQFYAKIIIGSTKVGTEADHKDIKAYFGKYIHFLETESEVTIAFPKESFEGIDSFVNFYNWGT